MTHYVKRSATLSLDGLWEFSFLGATEAEAFDPAGFVSTDRMPVPAAFDALPDYAGRRGLAAYRRLFTVPSGRMARLEFGAVSMWTRVFIDGELRREHACGYGPFSVDVRAAAVAEREVTVLVDNRFDFDRVPMHEEYFDFYQYGGILRPVTLRLLPATGPWIEAVRVLPAEHYRQGGVQVRIELGGPVPARMEITAAFDGVDPRAIDATPDAEGAVALQLTVPAPCIWSTDTPHLHRLRIALPDGRQDGAAEDSDAIEVRFGLRRIEAREGALWLNGERLQLRGYNRHEWHPNYGPSTPVLQMIADIQLLRDLGCNFVRGAHYQQDQRFLDLCDEYGLLVWEENLGWGQRERTFASEKFRRDHDQTLRAMVRASWNHPSVIIWGLLNEVGSDADYVRPVLEESVATLRALDPSRLVSYASMFALADRHFDLVDLIGLNLYPGWYDCRGVDAPLNLIEPHIRKCFDHLDAQGFSGKPVIISEIGAEALYGWHDPHQDFFSEEFQARYLRQACLAALGHPRCSGVALWHFSDVRTYGGGWSLKRPRTFNNKGTLDEYRRPKLAYAAVREVFRHAKPAAKPLLGKSADA